MAKKNNEIIVDKEVETTEIYATNKMIGNQFWKLKSSHGRKKIFETPEIMLKACYEFFEYQSKQTWDRIDYKGKDIEMVKIPTPSPFTMEKLTSFLGVNTQYFGDFKKTCSEDFSLVIRHIEEIIYIQKFEGATVGAYNANIIARDLGLKDKSETDLTSGGEKLNVINLGAGIKPKNI